eukprot:TRINITY_DN6155_c0_g1_i1.p1 TRINITY_DN6155_c0_g1~~TRINITY_DN6155_c0_g1_i1.p1  ORF type:complete len:187 (+),score=67.27 TRINITY_DN6155_c0_g1_i1:38-562(+)
MRKLNYDKQDPSQYKKLKRNFDKVKEENIDLKNKAKTSDQRMAQLERELVDLKDTLKKNANASPNPSSSAAGAGERVVEASHQEPEDIKEIKSKWKKKNLALSLELQYYKSQIENLRPAQEKLATLQQSRDDIYHSILSESLPIRDAPTPNSYLFPFIILGVFFALLTIYLTTL